MYQSTVSFNYIIIWYYDNIIIIYNCTYRYAILKCAKLRQVQNNLFENLSKNLVFLN